MSAHYAFDRSWADAGGKVVLPTWARRYSITFDGLTYILSIYSY